jgi:hypothetical protein
MVNRFAVLRGLVVLTSISIFSTVTWAQGLEVSGFGGAMTMDGGVGTHAAYGGAAAFRLGDHIHIFGQFSYSTLASSAFSTTSSGVTVTGNASVNVESFGGGIDYTFKAPGSKLRPFVTGGLGVGHFYGSGSGTGSNGGSASVSVGLTNALYTEVGGGVRLYVTKHLGLKPEVVYRRYQSSLFSSNAVQYTAGVFYQFGE